MAVSGDIESERKVLKFLIQTFFDVSLFQLIKVTFQRRKFITSSRLSSGRIMENYSKILVLFACFSNLISYF